MLCRTKIRVLVQTQHLVPAAGVPGTCRASGALLRSYTLRYRDSRTLRRVDGNANNFIGRSPRPRARFKPRVERRGTSRTLPAGRGGRVRLAIPWEEESVRAFGRTVAGAPILARRALRVSLVSTLRLRLRFQHAAGLVALAFSLTPLRIRPDNAPRNKSSVERRDARRRLAESRLQAAC